MYKSLWLRGIEFTGRSVPVVGVLEQEVPFGSDITPDTTRRGAVGQGVPSRAAESTFGLIRPSPARRSTKRKSSKKLKSSLLG